MPTLFTIGHSNRSLDEFIALIQAHELEQIIDVRSIPKSRLVPWFNKEALAKTLRKLKIRYHHLPELGGRRRVSKSSINTGWIKDSFRGYADYMQTEEFFQGLKKLNELMKGSRTAIMCAEAVPWRCHRSLIGDAELVRGVKVLDIISASAPKEHQLTSFAVVDRDTRPIKVYYPDPNLKLPL